jgi:hypothetical protein
MFKRNYQTFSQNTCERNDLQYYAQRVQLKEYNYDT